MKRIMEKIDLKKLLNSSPEPIIFIGGNDMYASKNEQTKKCRNFMYTQQVSHLPNGMTPGELFSLVDKHLKPLKWAGIVHDNDKKDDNVTPAEDNVHVMMQFKNARSLKKIAKVLGDQPQYIEKWKGDVNNGFAYLIHATKNARHKHQYSCDEVRANFDYARFMKKVMQKVSKVKRVSSANRINEILDLIGGGKMSFKQAKEQLSGSVYAKNSKNLKIANELYLERCADKLYKEMEENNELVDVHWFYGSSEAGKTFLAKKLAHEAGNYYVAATEKDAFQYYQGEQVVILDELRPGSIAFSELLSMFDPFSRGRVTTSSRYFNKPLSCKTFYVTTPLSPTAFYNRYRVVDKDSGNQLFRRLSSVLKFDEDSIYKMEYDEKTRSYKEVSRKDNPYSKKNQSGYVLKNIFDKI